MLSVIVIAYNEKEYIAQCLEALTQQDTNEKFEVIVVDNASTDRTAEIAQSFSDRLNLRVIKEAKKGRGAARAAGFTAAEGEIILSTDADCIAPQSWIQKLVSALRMSENIVGVTSPLEINDCSPIRNWILNRQPLLMWFHRLVWGYFWLNGFSFAIRSSTYETAGGFNPDFNAQEDTELSRRVRKLGRIQLLRSPRMIASGRRFQCSIICGLWSYLSSFCAVRLSEGKKRAELSDVR